MPDGYHGACYVWCMRRATAWLTMALLLAAASPSQAFVTPRWNAQRESKRSTLIGRWSAVTFKTKSAQKIDDLGLLVVFTPTELRIEEGSKSEKASWKIVRQEADLLELDVLDAKGRHHALDVLVEGSDALTLYFQDDDGEDEASVRLERVH